MREYAAPYLLAFPKLGEPSTGYISVAEQRPPMPFAPKRVFWTYHTPESILRGRHAHYHTEQVLVAVAGRIIVTTEQANGDIRTFRLENPFEGLYVPPCTWHTMQYSHSAVQLVLASTVFDEGDYIRSHQLFLQTWRRP
jgi:mannose-6-phosphate isomerase-like protein (cupin superfamily)